MFYTFLTYRKPNFPPLIKYRILRKKNPGEKKNTHFNEHKDVDKTWNHSCILGKVGEEKIYGWEINEFWFTIKLDLDSIKKEFDDKWRYSIINV